MHLIGQEIRYICSANNCHISLTINFLKHFRTLILSSESTFTPLTPRNANLGCTSPWVTQGCKISDTSSCGSLSWTTLLVSDSLSESSSLVTKQKSSDSSENTSLLSFLSKNLDTSSSVSRSFFRLLLDTARVEFTVFQITDMDGTGCQNKLVGGAS
jgi:hypothetical protein